MATDFLFDMQFMLGYKLINDLGKKLLVNRWKTTEVLNHFFAVAFLVLVKFNWSYIISIQSWCHAISHVVSCWHYINPFNIVGSHMCPSWSTGQFWRLQAKQSISRHPWPTGRCKFRLRYKPQIKREAGVHRRLQGAGLDRDNTTASALLWLQQRICQLCVHITHDI